eukprot:gene7254-8023_t
MNYEVAGSYEGEMVDGRYQGRGVYHLQDCRYEGSFQDGKFHGEGVLYVPGGYFKGFWRSGQLVEGGFVFEDGLPFAKVEHKFWDYCTERDRRFAREISDGLPIEGPLRDVTSHAYADKLPVGCYDTIDGYYDPKRHMVMDYETGQEKRSPDPAEIDFILKNCRIGK